MRKTAALSDFGSVMTWFGFSHEKLYSPSLSTNQLNAAFKNALSRDSSGLGDSRVGIPTPKCPRRDPDGLETPLYNIVHFYGTMDNMTTIDVNRYFRPFQTLRVEWLNDACCNVHFASCHSAIQAILTLSSQMDARDPDVQVQSMVRKWRRAVSFRGNEQQAFLMRIATNRDVKVVSPGAENRWTLPYVKRFKQQTRIPKRAKDRKHHGCSKIK